MPDLHDDETEAYRLGELDGWRDQWGKWLNHGWESLDRLRLAYWFGFATGREERRRRFTERYGYWVEGL